MLLTQVMSLNDLKSLPKTDLTSQVGCPNSKRQPTTTSLFGGVLLKDLLRVEGIVQEDEESSSPPAVLVQSIVFHAMDGETVTVTTTDTSNNNGNYHNDDILVAYEENGAPLTHQRGFPVRVIIPAASSAGPSRVVKWVKRIEVRL
jgi:DMSO/TMAO reductase YedYZ molybdopterin-dependent catalytic subunit